MGNLARSKSTAKAPQHHTAQQDFHHACTTTTPHLQAQHRLAHPIMMAQPHLMPWLGGLLVVVVVVLVLVLVASLEGLVQTWTGRKAYDWRAGNGVGVHPPHPYTGRIDHMAPALRRYRRPAKLGEPLHITKAKAGRCRRKNRPSVQG